MFSLRNVREFRALAVLGSTWVLAVAVTLLSWYPRSATLLSGLDPSANTGLHLAFVDGLDFGRQLIFTYGPLGFLASRADAFDSTAIWSAVYIVVVRYTLCCTLLHAARRSFPLLIALPLAVAGAVVVNDEELIGIAFLWSAIALAPDPPGRSRDVAVYGTALVAALALLIKPSLGISILVIGVLAVLGLPGERRRNALGFGATFAISVLFLLIVSRQSLLAFPDYIANTLQIATGYQTAFVLGDPSAGVFLLAALMIGGAIAWAVYAGEGLRRIQRIALLLVVAYYCYTEFKTGFTRYDESGHTGRFVAAMMLPWFAFAVRGWAQRGIALVAIAGICALWFPLSSKPADLRLDLLGNAGDAMTDVRGLVDAGRRHEIRDSSRRALRSLYGLDARALGLLRGERVDAETWEASLIWAYDLDWSPAPVFQALAANTPKLDEINAGWLSDPDGPTRIIKPILDRGLTSRVPAGPHIESVDGRYAAYDTPMQTLAILCHFAPLDTTPRWLILGRTEDRCGERRELTTVTAGWDEPVPVPPPPGPDQVVLAKVDGLTPSALEMLRTSLFRGLRRWIVFGGGARFELTPQNAGEPLLLRAPPRSDLPLPYAFAPNPLSIAFERESGFPPAPDELEITFEAMKVEPTGEGTVRGFR